MDKQVIGLKLAEIAVKNNLQLSVQEKNYLLNLYDKFYQNDLEWDNPILKKELADKEKDIEKRISLYKESGELALMQGAVKYDDIYITLVFQCFEKGYFLAKKNGFYESQIFFLLHEKRVEFYFDILSELEVEMGINSDDSSEQRTYKKSEEIVETYNYTNNILDIINSFPKKKGRKFDDAIITQTKRDLKKFCSYKGIDFQKVIDNTRLKHYLE